MRRADRLFQIIQILRGGRLVTAARMSQTLEVSERTVYRDIADLQSSGVPIDGAAGLGYILRGGFDLPPLMFTRDELAALMAGARMVKAWAGERQALAAEEAMAKIEAVVPDRLATSVRNIPIYAPSTHLPNDVRQVLDEIDRAIA
ncbi:MAG: HTH domain-containing protein, partial [Pseudomonadota bacterium]